jgi:ribonuclease P protein component
LGGKAIYGLPRAVRLHRQADFARVRQEGRTWADRLLVLGAAPNGLPYSRFGFVVGRRIGKAVRRNRAKRLLREAVRLHRPRIRPGWDLVWIARAEVAGAGFAEVMGSVEALLRQAGLLEDGTQARQGLREGEGASLQRDGRSGG